MRRRLDIVTPEIPLEGLQDQIKVFLAGPIQGAPDWQNTVPVIPGVTWISPRRLEGDGFDYDSQIEWETTGLRIANIILFWIPAPSEDIPGRCYSQTTRIEFGETLGRGEKKVVAGCYPSYPGRKYLEKKLSEYQGRKLHETLEDTVKELRKEIEGRGEGVFFTSDTHFGSSRALKLSQRPFRNVKEMDWTMISRWNSKVWPGDKIYHLGDFGEEWPLEYLSGQIKMVRGNYEEEDETLPEILHTPEGYVLSHTPGKIKDLPGPKLFGHIHGRQKIKPWGGVDVGVDAWRYWPVGKDEVDFLLEAISKGYYDNEVWD